MKIYSLHSMMSQADLDQLDSSAFTMKCFSTLNGSAYKTRFSWTQPSPLNDQLTVALDLDDVLVYSSIFKPAGPSQCIEYCTDEGRFTFYIQLREGVHEFLAAAASVAELVILTRAAPEYVDAILSLLDPGWRLFSRCYCRSECVRVGDCYMKDLAMLGLSLTRTLVVQFQSKAGCTQASQVLTLHSRDQSELAALAAFIATIRNEPSLSFCLRVYAKQRHIKTE